jgi:hypothetical protein
MKTYTIDGIKIISRAMEKQRDFVSWENVWLFIKVLIGMEAVYYSLGMPISALAVAVVMTWAMWQITQF